MKALYTDKGYEIKSLNRKNKVNRKPVRIQIKEVPPMIEMIPA
jgi:hypothetical protein